MFEKLFKKQKTGDTLEVECKCGEVRDAVQAPDPVAINALIILLEQKKIFTWEEYVKAVKEVDQLRKDCKENG